MPGVNAIVLITVSVAAHAFVGFADAILLYPKSFVPVRRDGLYVKVRGQLAFVVDVEEPSSIVPVEEAPLRILTLVAALAAVAKLIVPAMFVVVPVAPALIDPVEPVPFRI
jgi:hypothetical protein